MSDAHWTDAAACAGMDTNLWFPPPGRDSGTEARAICNTCPVRAECLDHALVNGEKHGIWGGLSERERRQVRRRRGLVGLPRPVIHGTENQYRHGGCRCDPCRLAATIADRRRRVS